MIQPWLAERRAALTGTATPITLADSREWLMQDGALLHRTGGFFSIIGIEADAPGTQFDQRRFPMIDQPEIGLLAFLTTPGADGLDWLLQAKSEPGTTEWVQVGPTVQATYSNYARRHGGRPTTYLANFLDQDSGRPIGLHQSEQGTRFLNKFNSNAVVTLPERCQEAGPNWKWSTSEELRRALGEDFCINTDSRSVIVSHDWCNLRSEAPLFAGPSGTSAALAPLRAALARSYAALPGRPAGVQDCLKLLDRARAEARLAIRRVPLETVPGWRTDGWIDPVDEAGGVAIFRISAPDREVEAWDQPFLISDRSHRCGLVLADFAGVPRLGFQPSLEPGFVQKIQFGPSFQTDTVLSPILRELIIEGRHPPSLAVRQSDEGGRFLRVEMCYELHDMRGREAALEGAGLVWLRLDEVEALCRQRGLLTNEARSALSLVLSLA